jgi:hypothetical protein
MIEIASLASLFVEVFGASKDWTEYKKVHLDPNAIDDEQIVRELRTKGHKIELRNEMELRQLARKGWKPVIERDAIGRPSIFVDRLDELVLVHRPPE